MSVNLLCDRQMIVDNGFHKCYIQSSGSEVCGNEYRCGAIVQHIDSKFTVFLFQSAVIHSHGKQATFHFAESAFHAFAVVQKDNCFIPCSKCGEEFRKGV